MNIKLVSLPAYSPELNPTEHVWDELCEKYFHNIAFDSLNAVEDVLEIGLRELENDKLLIKSTTGFSWILNIIYIATPYDHFRSLITSVLICVEHLLLALGSNLRYFCSSCSDSRSYYSWSSSSFSFTMGV